MIVSSPQPHNSANTDSVWKADDLNNQFKYIYITEKRVNMLLKEGSLFLSMPDINFRFKGIKNLPDKVQRNKAHEPDRLRVVILKNGVLPEAWELSDMYAELKR